MSRWLKEPLLHFLVLGAGIFLAYGILSEGDGDRKEIRVSRGQQENLLNTFSRTWQRMPTPEEFQGLLREYIRQEIAYRESRAMGLDEGDIVVRRRMRQKMEMLAEDVAGLVPPGEDELRVFLDDHAEDFMLEASLSLQQVYFSSDRRGPDAPADAAAVLEQLADAEPGADLRALGDPLPLPGDLSDISSSELERLFGSGFAEQLGDVEAGRWSGPLRSGYGLHLVYVSDRVAARRPELAEVREAVERELMSLRRQEAVDALYDRLAENYRIEIDPLIDATETGTATP